MPSQKERNARWYSNPENREKAKRKSSLRYSMMTEAEYQKMLEYGREYRARNAERLREKARVYMRKRRAECRETLLERTRKWRAENPGCNTKQTRNYRGYPTPTRSCPETCECCGRKPNGRGSLHLDHCHGTNKFRGWLCHSCNNGIGLLGDSQLGLARAALYLDRTSV